MPSTARARTKIVTRAGLGSLLLAAAAAVLPAAAAGLPAAAASMPAAARTPAVPDPGSGSELRAVTCTSASNCWAVGDYGSGPVDGSEAPHWDGSAWTLVPTPDPAGAVNELDGVACGSPASCWAVGSYWDYSAQTRLSIALHWNGTSWSTG